MHATHFTHRKISNLVGVGQPVDEVGFSQAAHADRVSESLFSFFFLPPPRRRVLNRGSLQSARTTTIGVQSSEGSRARTDDEGGVYLHDAVQPRHSGTRHAVTGQRAVLFWLLPTSGVSSTHQGRNRPSLDFCICSLLLLWSVTPLVRFLHVAA